jgi:hypothetical protein
MYDLFEDGKKIKSSKYVREVMTFADGGMVNRDLNLYAQKRANELGITRKDLGNDYSIALAQALVEGLTDANFHSEVRGLISILEKKPEWAKDPYADKGSVPDFDSPQYSKWRENSVYSSIYYDADDNARQLGIDVSQNSGYDGYGIAMSFKYVAQMNGEQKLASQIDKAMGQTMADGGVVAKNYIVQYEINGVKHTSTYLLYPNDRVEKFLPPVAKIISIKEKMADGGETSGMEVVNYLKGVSGLRASFIAEWGDKNNVDLAQVEKAIKTKKLKPIDFSTALSGRDGNKYAKEIIAKYSQNKMAKGGMSKKKITFDDKVKAIQSSLLKRKKVSPKVQKEYGKTYNKKEALQSAKRIVGAMRKKGK